MQMAVGYAREAAACEEVPVGAVVVLDDRFIAGSGNRSVSDVDPCGHAEVLALRAAAKALGNYRMPGAQLYVSLEPCLMCFGAAVWARISRIVYAAPDQRHGVAGLLSGGSVSGLNHLPEMVQGTCGVEAGDVMKDFFVERRK